MDSTQLHKQVAHQLAKVMGMSSSHLMKVLALLEDNTVPFVARYRKEQTGGLDETQLRKIAKSYQYQKDLSERKQTVIERIDEKGLLTDALRRSILDADKLVEVEDIYRPYREKKKTKATMAENKGLKPLAEKILTFPDSLDFKTEASAYLSDEVESVEEALEGAQHIIAERISDDAAIRKALRDYFFRKGRIISKAKNSEKDPSSVYRMYYAFESPLRNIRHFRMLAMNRGEKEKVLRISIDADQAPFLKGVERQWIKRRNSPAFKYVKAAISDAYKRLLKPAVERDIRSHLTERAEDHAIHIFSENIKSLLLQPPLKGKRILGMDPAYRTGCKLALISTTGRLEFVDVIYPHSGGKSLKEAEKKLKTIIEDHQVEVVAIGNGTASRETEAFVGDVFKTLSRKCFYTIVNEAGASVYSASPLAKKEFPELDVEERSAVSIARRLLDPLSELVKIEPRSIGVGQYQHDVNQNKLTEALHFAVETVVNRVGVDVNTADVPLLKYISGMSERVAKHLVATRGNNTFMNREDLKSVPYLGEKTFEQSVGFLRINGGSDPLDKTSIHPESYRPTKTLLSDLGFSVSDVGTDALRSALDTVDIDTLCETLNIGRPTLEDILEALKAPGRDPRDDVEMPVLRSDVLALEDLKENMRLEGTVRNVVDFGAFIDCGVKEDGLVHISRMRNDYVKHPLDVVSVGDVVPVYVESVDLERRRLQLTMIEPRE